MAEEKPLTRDDVLRLIEQNGGTARGLDLSNCKFVEKIDLSDLDLSGIILNNARLFRAIFDGSNLDGAIMQGTNLRYATFNPLKSKAAILSGVDLRGAHLENAEFREADLSAAHFEEEPERLLPAFLTDTDFRGAQLFLANFKGCYFYGTKLEGAFIRGADITIDTHLGDADWGNYVIGEENKKEFYFAEHRYRHLKAWYIHAGYYDTAAKFQYRETEARRKKLKLFSKFWNHRVALQFSYWVFGHGEGWKRLLFGWIVGVILSLALLYFFLRGISPYTLTVQAFLNSLYYSAVSFTALGYGPWFKSSSAYSWVQGVGAAESFAGVLMMALLLVTFVRKWTR